jgi:hypothetical protein
MRLFGGWGVGVLFIGLGLGGYLLGEKILRHIAIVEEHGPLLVLSAVLIIAGIHLISLGLIGELISRTYYESQGKPIYAIREVRSRRLCPQLREPEQRRGLADDRAQRSA